MTRRTTGAIVADIKTRYKRANAEKLVIQKDMVELRDEHGWTQQQIADKTGIHRSTVRDWLLAYDEQISEGFGEVAKLTPQHHKQRSDRAVARRVLAEDPQQLLASLSPTEQRKAAAILDAESAKRQKDRERASKQKEREHLGDETVEELGIKEELQSTEYLLIKARGNIRGFISHARELGRTPKAWRQSCLEWIEDLDGHLGMAKALLEGDDIDWTAFEELLASRG